MDLGTLRELTELKYQQSLSGLSKILDREASLRAEISRLRALAFEAQALPASKPAMQNIGADVIWLQWVSKTTKALNIELAQVLAQKESLLASQRLALGRRSVATKLVEDNRKLKAMEKADAALSQAIEQDLMRRNQ
ncbi:hypothetical protein [Tateyamaria sp. SN6-1]|uniref:hypothetical protein n=1 Tax=Tateyamaria sp. SN6-1 TaxID=3092148 RepID=UPI0039F60C1F